MGGKFVRWGEVRTLFDNRFQACQCLRVQLQGHEDVALDEPQVGSRFREIALRLFQFSQRRLAFANVHQDASWLHRRGIPVGLQAGGNLALEDTFIYQHPVSKLNPQISEKGSQLEMRQRIPGKTLREPTPQGDSALKLGQVKPGILIINPGRCGEVGMP